MTLFFIVPLIVLSFIFLISFVGITMEALIEWDWEGKESFGFYFRRSMRKFSRLFTGGKARD